MTLKDLQRMALLRQHEKYPNVPIHALYVKPFKDATANELTRSIEAFVRMSGHYADRINNTGIYDKRTGRWRKGGTRKGIADIMAAKNIMIGDRKVAITVAIEVKIGKDSEQYCPVVKVKVGTSPCGKESTESHEDWVL